MGSAAIDAIFEHCPLNQQDLAFVFPERHMGVAEQHSLTHHLAAHPEDSKTLTVDIITSSPMIIGSFMREQIRILTWPEDSGLYDCYGTET